MCYRYRRRKALSYAAISMFLAIAAPAQESQSSLPDSQAEIARISAENAALRDELERLQEQQAALWRMIAQMQREAAIRPAVIAEAPVPPPAALPSSPSSPPEDATPPQSSTDRTGDPAGVLYEDSIVLAKTPENSRIPLLLRLWDVTQIRYTNTLLGNTSYTDHLGAARPVTARNDISLNRNLLQFVGYVFDKRLQFNLIIWASNSSAAIVTGGYVSWKFNKAITAYAGYWGAPGTRSLTGTFPYFVQLDRSMADQFFRPGFTQGVWIDGEPWKGLHYELFVGNGLNTLTIPTSKIDRHLAYSGSVWWEPLGTYGIPGRARGMYDDYQSRRKPAVRFGASYTQAKENRFSSLDQANPENTGVFNSDGVNTFATGAFAPGVTVDDATYRMFSTDGGVKWRGFAFNYEYFLRRLNRFIADGPLPIHETFDQGFEAEISQFVVPKKLELYGRTSFVFGQFRDSYEYAPGVKWYLVGNHRVWLVAEGLRIVKSPVSSIITPYNSGYTGWAPLLQWMFNF